MTAPLVSVCVPTRNRANYLGGALASALAQNIDLEVLVHDDASTDDTSAVVAGIGDPRVRYIQHTSALGVAMNRNTCLVAARGRHVAWLDSDDEYLPGMLAGQVAVLEQNRDVGIVHGGFHVVGARGERLRDWPAPFESDTVEPARDAFRQLIASNELTTSTVVARRDVFNQRAVTFRPDVGPSGSDWDAWLRIARHAAVAYIAEPVARYRQHPDTISSATSSSGQRLRCDIAIVRHVLRRHAAGLPDARRVAGVAHAALAAKALDHAGDLLTRGCRAQSARAVALSARLAPGSVGPLAPRLLGATARGDEYACYRTTKAARGRLADRLEGTRYGAKVRRAAMSDPDWERALERIAQIARRSLPRDATVAALAKWDPTLLRLIGHRARNFPDRRLMPDGYPRDDAAAIEHLERLRGEGVSHLVVPSASFWWLEHYGGLRRHLDRRYQRRGDGDGDDCIVIDLRARD